MNELIAELERLRDELDREYAWWAIVRVWFTLGFPHVALTMLLRRAVEDLVAVLPLTKGIADAFALAIGGSS